MCIDALDLDCSNEHMKLAWQENLNCEISTTFDKNHTP